MSFPNFLQLPLYGMSIEGVLGALHTMAVGRADKGF
jgi:hypothetical protein